MLSPQESLSETIVACATPPGEGAIAVVRLSGPEARAISYELRGIHTKADIPSHKMVRVKLYDKAGEILDDAMVAEMHCPRSYTGEDVVEFYLHGSRAIVTDVLKACQHYGARLAGPGEFTMRAFLNGRIDLAQAEAVADLISARSQTQRRVAAAQLEGGLSRRINEILTVLEGILAQWRAVLDFPEYPTGDGLLAGHYKELENVQAAISKLIAGIQLEVRKGRQVVLCGAPNVGKSSLLNAWLGEERVLVDDSPGTTRDPIEVELLDEGHAWIAWDTAGIRANAEPLEARGIAMALDRIKSAEEVLWLLDGTNPSWPESLDGNLVIVATKSDLVSSEQRERVSTEAIRRGHDFFGWISVRSSEGLQALRHLASKGRSNSQVPVENWVVRERHAKALRLADEELHRALGGLRDGFTLDVLSQDIEAAAKALGSIVGRDVDLAVLDLIFSEFCIGK